MSCAAIEPHAARSLVTLATVRKHVGLIVVSTGTAVGRIVIPESIIFKCVCKVYELIYVFYILKLTQLVESRRDI